jgi:hypothetical protein
MASSLSKRELKILKAYGEVLIPLPSEKLRLTFDDVDLMNRINDYLGKFSGDTFWGFRLILWTMEFGALFFKFSLKSCLKCRLN